MNKIKYSLSDPRLLCTPGVLTMGDPPSLPGACIGHMSDIIVLLQVACCVGGPAKGATGCKVVGTL